MVSRTRRPYSPARLGIALSATELCVSYVGSAAEPLVRRLSLQPAPIDSASWPALEQALTELKSNPGGERLSISLMSSLAEVRAVELPPLRDDEAERVLARGASKYFVGARQPQIVSVSRAARASRTVPSVAVAAATPVRLIAALRAAATAAGFTIDAIGPAESAWAAAATSQWPAMNSGNAAVLVSHADRTDLLRLESGRLSALRRFRAGAADVESIAAAIRENAPGGSVRVAALGAANERAGLVQALASRGITAQTQTDRSTGGEADALAAMYAAPSSGPVFRTEDLRVARRAAAWRATAAVAAAACVLIVAGAAIHLWGLHRQLDILRAERNQIAPRLSATLIGRTSVENVSRSVTALNDIERVSPRWAQAISRLSNTVPEAAYLTAFRTRGDSLIIEGLAEQASDVFNAIERVPSLANVRAGAPVRREVQSDTTPLERFTIVARLTPEPAR
jgi:hypothetical protein